MQITTNYTNKTKTPFSLAEVVTSLGLFLLALLPRAYDLPRFVTADEAKWVYRSAQFLAAFLRGDFAATSVNLTPAVTTTWLGSLGLAIYYRLNQTTIGLPLTDWLRSLPEFRTELDVLVATRWPMVIFTSLGVVAIYLLGRRLFDLHLAFFAAALVALDPHTVALSRILGHDAPTAVFMTLCLLLLLLSLNSSEKQTSGETEQESPPPPHPPAYLEPLGPSLETGHSRRPLLLLILSGVMAGLAFLSKAPALFLIPFAGLIFASKIWGHSTMLYFWFKRFLLWLIVAYLAFIAFWPAAWVDPVGRPLTVVENAVASATDQEEADTEGYWLVPNLGPVYYLVNGAFKLSPLVLIGTGLAVWQISRSARQRGRKSANDQPAGQTCANGEKPASPSPTLWLLAFVLLFTIFMTLGDKRSPRYILPAFPPLALIAASGWSKLWQHVLRVKYQVSSTNIHTLGNIDHGLRTTDHASRLTPHASRFYFLTLLTLSALLILLPYTPYYFTYFNPLLGGSYTAPHLVKIGWGEGLDQVGRFLQRESGDSRVGTAYASTVAPFFKGDLSSVTGDNLDYVILYRKQIQSGKPSPTFIRYFEYFGSIFSVDQNGIRYAGVYPGPAVQPALSLTPGLDTAILPKPIGFRPLTPYGQIGQPLEFDVLWLADDPLPITPSTVTLQPISAFDFLNEPGHPHDDASESPREITILAEGQGSLTRLAGDLIVSRHRLELPADLERGRYALLVDGRPLGEVELRNFQVPVDMGRVEDTIFADQIALAAYQFEPTEDYIGVTIAWQARATHLPDYTVFVQLLDAEVNERLAGVDTQPLEGEWPTRRWIKNEVVVDKYFVAVPPGLPPGFYKVIVGFYQPETGQRLTLADGQDHWTLPWTFVWEE